MRIAPHFSLAELTRTDTGLPNQPSELAILNLKRLAEVVLEPIRDLLGCRLILHSGYRSKAVNRAVAGAVGSAHLDGRAADFHPETAEPIRLVFDRIRKSGIPFDRMILEFKKGKAWIHIEIPHESVKFRRQAFIAQVSDSSVVYEEIKK